MGRRGPRKQPTQIAIARGNPGKRPLNHNEPQPPDGEIVPPSFVVGKSLDKWNEVLPKLQAMRVMTPADAETLGRYCVYHEQFVKYADQMRRGLDVLVIKDKDGKVKYVQSTPAATMFVKLGQSMLRIEQEFGLTPSARAGIEVPFGKEYEEEAALLRRFTGRSA